MCRNPEIVSDGRLARGEQIKEKLSNVITQNGNDSKENPKK